MDDVQEACRRMAELVDGARGLEATHGRIVGALRTADLGDGNVMLWCVVPRADAMAMARAWPVIGPKK